MSNQYNPFAEFAKFDDDDFASLRAIMVKSGMV